MRNHVKAAMVPLAAAGYLLLAGCDRNEETEVQELAPTPAVAAPTQSIIRPEAELARAQPEPEPLQQLTLTIAMPDGADLNAAAETKLEAALASEQMRLGGPVLLRGHTDSAGSDAANLRASQRRAEAVGEWLTSRGVAAERITIIALGEQNPVMPNANPDGTPNEAGRAANRRVELVLAPPVDGVAEATASNSEAETGQPGMPAR